MRVIGAAQRAGVSLLLGAALAVGFVGTPAVAASAATVTATLNVRSGPGTASTVIGTLYTGQTVTTLSASNGWSKIRLSGRDAYVSNRYLQQGASPTPAVAPVVSGAVRTTTTMLNLREGGGSGYAVLAVLSQGEQVTMMGRTSAGFGELYAGGTRGWASLRYLSSATPSAPTPAKPSVPTSASYDVERGLTPNAIQVHRAARARFPQITTYYGVRRDALSDHPSGRALDLMIPAYTSEAGKALGQQVADWARANARSLGIQYVIWNQQIWNIQRDGEGWRPMASRGGDSADHKNHVHISVYG